MRNRHTLHPRSLSDMHVVSPTPALAMVMVMFLLLSHTPFILASSSNNNEARDERMLTQALFGLREQHLLEAMRMEHDVAIQVLFNATGIFQTGTNRQQRHANEYSTALLNRLLPSTSHQHDRLIRFVRSRFRNFFAFESQFTTWSLNIYNIWLTQMNLAGTPLFSTSSVSHRSLLVGLRAAYVLAHNTALTKLTLNHLSIVDPVDEFIYFTGLSGRAPPQPTDITTSPPTYTQHDRSTRGTIHRRHVHRTRSPSLITASDDPTIPDVFDMTPLFSPARNQGSCGSCWAFAAVAVMEGILARKNQNVMLSEQELVSCDPKWAGCGGGWAYDAWEYAAENPSGLTTELIWPYTSGLTGAAGTCYVDKFTLGVAIPSDTFETIPGDELSIKRAMVQYGPLSIAMGSKNPCFSSYAGGILNCTCPDGPRDFDHALTLVGWGPDYWILRNSWGKGWGENGYVRIAILPFPGLCAAQRYVNALVDAFAVTTTPFPTTPTSMQDQTTMAPTPPNVPFDACPDVNAPVLCAGNSYSYCCPAPADPSATLSVCCPNTNHCVCGSGSCPVANACCGHDYPVMCGDSPNQYCCRQTDSGSTDVCCANNMCACPSGQCPGPQGTCCASTTPNVCGGGNGVTAFCCPDGLNGRKDVCCLGARVCSMVGTCPSSSVHKPAVVGLVGNDLEVASLPLPNQLPAFLVGEAHP